MLKTKPSLTITYCPKCGWLTRSSWMAQELLMTFEDELDSVTLKPHSQAGVFRIESKDICLWDRSIDKGFPDIKTLKKLVRNHIAPEKNLGHTDR